MGFDFPNRLPIGDALNLGFSVSLLGISIVFIGLISLIIITIIYPKVANWLLPIAVHSREKRASNKAARQLAKAEKKAAAAGTVQVQPAQSKTTAAAPVAAQPSNDALVAVITAAVAASLGTSSNGIRIRSFRRSSTPAWGREGKLEQFRF